MKDSARIMKNIINNVENVIVGKRYAIELAVITLICRPRIDRGCARRRENQPGICACKINQRIIQKDTIHPDILPSDITGFSVYNQKTCDFEYRPGAIMSQIILADEINRTTPKLRPAFLRLWKRIGNC